MAIKWLCVCVCVFGVHRSRLVLTVTCCRFTESLLPPMHLFHPQGELLVHMCVYKKFCYFGYMLSVDGDDAAAVEDRI